MNLYVSVVYFYFSILSNCFHVSSQMALYNTWPVQLKSTEKVPFIFWKVFLILFGIKTFDTRKSMYHSKGIIIILLLLFLLLKIQSSLQTQIKIQTVN